MKTTAEERVCRMVTRKVGYRQDGGEQSKIAGLAAVYYDGTPETEFQLWEGAVERIMPGTFARALGGEDEVVALYNHDPNLVLGATKSGTLRLSDSPEGLRYEIDTPDTQVGRDLVETLRRGDVNGSSFSFALLDVHWIVEDGVDVRVISGVRLSDVGPVTFPAYEATESQLREARDSYEAWRKRPCERCEQLDAQVRDLRRRARAAELRLRAMAIER